MSAGAKGSKLTALTAGVETDVLVATQAQENWSVLAPRQPFR